MRKLLEICHRFKEIGIYLFVGVLTTAINYLVYLSLLNLTNLPGALCNAVAWAAAVLFAFVSNKPFVYHSHDWTGKTVFAEFKRFAGCRLISGMIETVAILFFVDILSFNGEAVKLITSLLVVIMNYLTGKLLVFPEK